MTSQKKKVLYDSDSDEDSSEVESIDNDTIESSEEEDVEINETTDDEIDTTDNKKKSMSKRAAESEYLTADSDISGSIDDTNVDESLIDEISPIKKSTDESLNENISPIKKPEDESDVEDISPIKHLKSDSDEDENEELDSHEETRNQSESVNNTNSFLDDEAHASMENQDSRDESYQDSPKSSDNEHSEDEEVIKKVRKNARRLIDSDDEQENDQDEEKRKTLYMENPDGDTSFIVEDNVFSKSTRRSIFGFNPEIKHEPISDNELSDAEDSDVIICETESEEEGRENLENSGMIAKKMSSTIRSPFKEIDNNVAIKQEPVISPEKSKTLQRVSKSYYDAQVAEIEAMQGRIDALRKMELTKSLPDGGAKLRIAAAKIQNDIDEKERLIKSLIVDDDKSIKNQLIDSFKSESERSSMREDSKDEDYLAAEDVQPKYTGKIGMKNFEQQKALTVEKLQDIHASLDQRPADDVLETPPNDLKIDLMKHQLHALAFMMWRETQKPRGGILADDMGLGKTLTVIALILKQLQRAEEMDEESDYESDENDKQQEDQWIARGHKSLRDGGTLVICPASLINQWEHEIKNKLKRNALNVNVFHGPKREYRAKILARYDVVITTYQIILSESKNDGCLFGIKWDRIVLDEGHVIRNYRSKQSEAVCALIAKKRWVLTGTPIQNKEFDIYAAIKFLRCSPFDDIRYWRMWIETKKGSSPRLQTLLKSILLRRTKQQLMETGEVQSLPEKQYEEFQVVLNREERSVYNRILSFSQAIFAQFLAQHQEKHNAFTYDRNQLGKLHQKFAKINNVEREVKAHEILTLLLRLRQVCCHPGLVKEAIASNEMDVEIDQGIKGLDTSVNDSDIDILKKLQNMKIDDSNQDVLNAAGSITTDNEVFDMNIPSSKLDKLMEIIREKVQDSNDKAIIVSQWVSYLNIIKGLLEIEGIGYCELNGTIPVKFRNDIVVNFNKPSSNERVMLLSITAGGVGLNLVGANMLFILDPHWNPQIEQQAQDRIYRFGQTKNVKIYKFICEDTIEEKILKIQIEKMSLAESALTGAKRNASKLTIEDLKDLFGMK